MLKFIFLFFLSLVLSKDPSLPEHTLLVYGNASLGYYYVTIFVGHPPQQQSVIIDTGSGQLALPCNKCTGCNPKHIDTPFDMTKSKTAEYVTCESNEPQCRKCSSKNPTQSCKFSISYAEGSSLEGVIIKDSIQFQSFSEGEQIVTSFGCTTRETNLFLKQQANGIFGLAPQRSSTLLQDLYENHHQYSGEQLQFSLCLAKNGGLMTIGKVNNDLHLNEKSVKTTFSSKKNLYTLQGVGNIKIGDKFIHKEGDRLGYYGLFIDSGSTFTYFPRENFLIFKNQLMQRCNFMSQLCEQASGQSVTCFHIKGNQPLAKVTDEIFAPIVIQIGNEKILWKPTKYFLLRDKMNREICLAIQALDRYLLGANWMVDKDVVFNLKDKTVEIFPQANCKNKPIKEMDMSQYSNEVEGHQPLDYGINSNSGLTNKSFSSQILIVVGVVLVLVGIVGLFIIILSRDNKKGPKSNNPISTVQTEDHIEIGEIKQENSVS